MADVESPTPSGQVRVQAVERAMALLEALAGQTQMSLGDLAKAAGVHKSTAYRILHTLMELRYVEQDKNSGHYRAGLRLVEVGGMTMRSWPLHRAAERVMDNVAETLGEAVNLAVEDELRVVYVATVDAHNLLRMQLNVGRRAPLHCTAVGKALLAFSKEMANRLKGSARPLEALTLRTITDWQALEEELARIHQRGFAIDDEEQERGACCVAAPIIDSHGRVAASLGISAPSARLTPQRAEELGPALVQAANAVSLRLG